MKQHDNAYSTLNEALSDLNSRGFTRSYSMTEDGLYCYECKKTYTADEMEIVEFHRFEGQSDFDDMSIVYALEGNDGKKGVVIDAFGTYADGALGEFLKKVEFDDEHEQH